MQVSIMQTSVWIYTEVTSEDVSVCVWEWIPAVNNLKSVQWEIRAEVNFEDSSKLLGFSLKHITVTVFMPVVPSGPRYRSYSPRRHRHKMAAFASGDILAWLVISLLTHTHSSVSMQLVVHEWALCDQCKVLDGDETARECLFTTFSPDQAPNLSSWDKDDAQGELKNPFVPSLPNGFKYSLVIFVFLPSHCAPGVFRAPPPECTGISAAQWNRQQLSWHDPSDP